MAIYNFPKINRKNQKRNSSTDCSLNCESPWGCTCQSSNIKVYFFNGTNQDNAAGYMNANTDVYIGGTYLAA